MKGRREFLKGSLVFSGATIVGSAVPAQAAITFPIGLIYTKEAPGRWAGKEAAHAPRVKVEGRTVRVITAHPMSQKHFIVKHTLVTPEGKFIGEKPLRTPIPTPSPPARCPRGSEVLCGPQAFVIYTTSGLLNSPFEQTSPFYGLQDVIIVKSRFLPIPSL
jgi:superoxide reductase